MDKFEKTVYAEYEYYYFDGSWSCAVAIKRRFDGYCQQIQINPYGEDDNGKILYCVEINNNGFMFSNCVDIHKGDYLLYPSTGGLYIKEKNLDDYIIDNDHDCRKPEIRTFSYKRFDGNLFLVKEFISEFKSCIESAILSPDHRELVITPRYQENNDDLYPINASYLNGEKLYLSVGNCLVKTENGSLFIMPNEQALKEFMEDYL